MEIHKHDNPAPINIEPALVSLNNNTIPIILVNVSTESIEIGDYQLSTRASPIPKNNRTVLVEVTDTDDASDGQKIDGSNSDDAGKGEEPGTLEKRVAKVTADFEEDHDDSIELKGEGDTQ